MLITPLVSSITTLFNFLPKKIIEKSFDFGISKYQNSLNQKLELYKNNLLKETEEHKANLKIVELDHQIKYTKLYDERVQIIKQIHWLLIDFKIVCTPAYHNISGS